MRIRMGDPLNRALGIGAQHALWSKTGNVYDHLQRFPGVLFDPDGYIVFATRQDYERCGGINFGARVSIPNGIAAIPGYRKDARIRKHLPQGATLPKPKPHLDEELEY